MSLSSRRAFLSDSFFLAALTAAAVATPSQVMARTSKGKPSADKLRIGVIGLNGRGKAHVDGYVSNPNAEVVAICDIDLRTAEKAAAAVATKTGKKPKVYQDLRKLYEDKDIDAVSAALPIHWHSLAGIWAMQAGKDAYIEKPVSHNVSEGRRLSEAMVRYNKICQTGTQSRSHKAIKDAIAYIHSGKIGKVEVSRGLCYKPRKSIGMIADAVAPAEVDYDIWLGPAPKRAYNSNRYLYNWHWHWDYGAGDLGNQGIHQMDIARWALGKSTLPSKVHSVGGRFGYSDQGETPNTVVTTFEYGDQTLVFEVRGLDTPEYTGVSIGNIVYGSEGYVVFSSNYAVALAFDKAGNQVQKFSGGGDHFGNFVKAVRNRDTAALNAPIVEGHLSSALCHLGNISYRLGEPAVPAKELTGLLASNKHGAEAVVRYREHLKANNVDTANAMGRLGRVITIDPKKESITGDAEAASMLTRPYRTGFAVPSKI